MTATGRSGARPAAVQGAAARSGRAPAAPALAGAALATGPAQAVVASTLNRMRVLRVTAARPPAGPPRVGGAPDFVRRTSLTFPPPPSPPPADCASFSPFRFAFRSARSCAYAGSSGPAGSSRRSRSRSSSKEGGDGGSADRTDCANRTGRRLCCSCQRGAGRGARGTRRVWFRCAPECSGGYGRRPRCCHLWWTVSVCQDD